MTEWVCHPPIDEGTYGAPYVPTSSETRERRARAGYSGAAESIQASGEPRFRRSSRFAGIYRTETPPRDTVDVTNAARVRRSTRNAELYETALRSIPVAFEIRGDESPAAGSRVQSAAPNKPGQTEAKVTSAFARPIVRAEMANDVLIGPPGEQFDNVRLHASPEDSCGKKGYALSDSRNGRISYLSAVKDGVTLPAYCLNFNLNRPQGTSHDSGTLEQGVLSSDPKIRCAIAWVLANGYGRGTVVSEWNDALGVSGLDADDARFITAAAIWMIQNQLDPDSTFVGKCATGPTPDPAHLAIVNEALTRFIQLAKDYGEANPNCDDGGFDINCRPADDSGGGGGSGGGGSGRPSDNINWEYIEQERSITGCGTGSLPISICYHDSEKVKWSKFPDTIRIVCGKTLIGPFRFEGADASASGDPPEVTFDPCCECGDATSYNFADACGNTIKTPAAGEDFFVQVRVRGRFMCFEVCVGYVEWATHVWFIITPSNKQNVGTRQKCKVMLRDEEKGCMRICFTLWESEAPAMPAPMPVFYQQYRPQPCVLPPDIIAPPPIIVEHPKPPVTQRPRPPYPILVAPPPPGVPPAIFTPPPAVVPPLPTPQIPQVIMPQPILVGQPPPQPRVAPQAPPQPVFTTLPPSPPQPVPPPMRVTLVAPPPPQQRVTGMPLPPPPPHPPVPPYVRAIAARQSQANAMAQARMRAICALGPESAAAYPPISGMHPPGGLGEFAPPLNGLPLTPYDPGLPSATPHGPYDSACDPDLITVCVPDCVPVCIPDCPRVNPCGQPPACDLYGPPPLCKLPSPGDDCYIEETVIIEQVCE